MNDNVMHGFVDEMEKQSSIKGQIRKQWRLLKSRPSSYYERSGAIRDKMYGRVDNRIDKANKFIQSSNLRDYSKIDKVLSGVKKGYVDMNDLKAMSKAIGDAAGKATSRLAKSDKAISEASRIGGIAANRSSKSLDMASKLYGKSIDSKLIAGAIAAPVAAAGVGKTLSMIRNNKRKRITK